MKGVVVHGLLALLGLLAAYQTWTRSEDEEPPPGEVTVVACDASDFNSFSMQSETKKVTIQSKKLDGKPTYWLTVQTKKSKSAPSDKDGKNPKEVEKTSETEMERFLANDDFSELLKWIAPLRAIRALGKTTRELDKEFDAKKAQTTLALQCGGKTHRFDVGATTYGSGARYLKNTSTKEVFLIPGNVVSDLQTAKYKFMQKLLHGFELNEVDEAKVEAQSKSRRLVQRNRRDPGLAVWVDAAQPDRRNELFGNWFSQVEKLTAKKYLPLGEQPGSELKKETGEIESVLTIDYSQRGSSLGRMEMARVNADQEYYYARTEKTQTWVAVPESAAKLVAQDVAMVVGLEEPPAAGKSDKSDPKKGKSAALKAIR